MNSKLSNNTDNLSQGINNTNNAYINNKTKEINNLHTKKQLKIIHWNANSINNKLNEFETFLLKSLKPDIVSINETKLSEFRANMILDLKDYNTIHKARSENRNGAGGVGILIKKGFSYQVLKDELLENLECLMIKVFVKNFEFVFLSYYNPPQCRLDTNKLIEIQRKYKHVILCGDLNTKSNNLGCKNNNSNGELLDDLIINSNYMTVNNKDATFYRINDNSRDILDWCLISNNMHKNFKSFEVLKTKERIDKYKNERKSEIINLISKPELDKSIKDLNNKTSSGLDSICNLILKKLPEKFKNLLLKLFNKTLIESKIPQEWKR
jgi:hypothetical protein